MGQCRYRRSFSPKPFYHVKKCRRGIAQAERALHASKGDGCPPGHTRAHRQVGWLFGWAAEGALFARMTAFRRWAGSGRSNHGKRRPSSQRGAVHGLEQVWNIYPYRRRRYSGYGAARPVWRWQLRSKQFRQKGQARRAPSSWTRCVADREASRARRPPTAVEELLALGEPGERLAIRFPREEIEVVRRRVSYDRKSLS